LQDSDEVPDSGTGSESGFEVAAEIGERRRVVMDCLCTVNGNPVVIGEALVLAPKKPPG